MCPRSRGFGLGSAALLALLLLGGCADSTSRPNEDFRPPTVTESNAVTHIRNFGPERFLTVQTVAPSDRAQLLFLRNHMAVRHLEGGSLVPDPDGARVLLFDEYGVVDRVYQGVPAGARPLTLPSFVTADENEVRAIEPDGEALRFSGSEPVEWTAAPVEGPLNGGRRESWSGARTILEFDLAPIQPGEPLLWAMKDDELRPIGEVEIPQNRFLGHLVNTGWTAADGDGTVYFASTIRPEIRAFSVEGSELWRSTWEPPAGVEEPTLGIRDRQATPLFAVYQYGITLGPDGRIYVLAAPDPDEGPNTLLAFERDGTLVGSGTVEERSAIFLGADGQVHAIDPAEALSRTGAPERAPFPDFALPRLDGSEIVKLAEQRGKVVIVNFWASWCGPCRREMPMLRDYATTLDPDEVAVIGLNEDVVPEAGREFVEEIGGVGYPLLEGRGELRNRYNYRGLPYTVILDREGRVVRSFYGFGTSIDPIRTTVESELAAAPAPPPSPPANSLADSQDPP